MAKGGREGILDGVLRQVQVARRPRDDRDRPRPAVGEDLLDGAYEPPSGMSNTITGRSSIVPYGAPGHRFAQAIASSTDGTSMR